MEMYFTFFKLMLLELINFISVEADFFRFAELYHDPFPIAKGVGFLTRKPCYYCAVI